ncbi:PREDICTED: kallikrein-8 isoform X2 [Rhinopithecus bieti]|uniref:Kallikrein related peptidase 8 n=2 Tax=Rhinopithecus TaxID=542827 RepID=A0A2K6LDH1_RHIBE|nr:PREDICTED: kallikrein-8 isoform X2 [Rhinopithecus bieti]
MGRLRPRAAQTWMFLLLLGAAWAGRFWRPPGV